MYLITVEGGDGSGKGLATKVIAEVLEKEFCFTSVDITSEPRREHPLGRLAIDSVRTKTTTPESEAGLFAADRVDHSHSWILPRLEEGAIVVSERNVHSSLVYQGIVGNLGVDRVAHMNSAALIPDLCVWVDCDPEVALNRIKSGTLRAHSEKEEYFETSELQKQIRAGYHQLLSGKVEMPTPFDMGAVIGPVLNEGTEEEFKRKLKLRIRRFIHSHPSPLNVDTEIVEQHLIRKLLQVAKGQTMLTGLGVKPAVNHSDWLAGSKPWQVLTAAEKSHQESFSRTREGGRIDIPKSVLAHSISSICGTLSLLSSANIGDIRAGQGPVRAVSESHSHKIVRYLAEELDWIHQHKSLLGRDSTRNQLKEPVQPFGILSLVIWPLRIAIRKWQITNPKTHLRFAIGQIIRSQHHSVAVENTMQRLAILGAGKSDGKLPTTMTELVEWWQGSL